MTAPITRAHPDRFTPEHRANEERPPVYLLAPLSWREKAAWQADLVRAGAGRFPTDASIIAAIRKAAVELEPDNLPELLGAIDAFSDAVTAQAAGGPSIDDEVRAAYALIEDRLRGHFEVAGVMAERTLFTLIAPTLAAARALVGWENVALKFQRRGEVVPDEVLGALPAEDLAAIGGRALALLRPGEPEKKASASPSPSADDPKISTLHPNPEKHGPSLEKHTKRTRAN